MEHYLNKIVLCLVILSFSNNFAFADSFFGTALSPREKQKIEFNLQKSQAAIEALEALEMMMMFESLSEGNCSSFIEIEGAAKKGEGKSQWLLADLYNRGFCVKKNDRKALELLHDSADNKHEDAYHDLGVYYYNGIGTEKDFKQAYYWFKKAADAKQPKAYRYLAVMTLGGEGITQNYQDGYDFALLGAESGDHYAQTIVASLMSVHGTEFYNPFEGYKWALLAGQSDNLGLQKEAEKLIDKLSKELAIEKVQVAQDAVKNWKPDTEKAKVLEPITLPTLDENYADSLTPGQALNKLKELGIDIDRDIYFQAVNEDNIGVFKLFIKAGAPLDARIQGMYATPLFAAVHNGSQNIFDFLLKNNVDLDTPINHDKDTALLRALSSGQLKMAKTLLARGASVTNPGMVYSAVQYNDPLLLKELIDAGAPWDNEYIPGSSPLSEAISGNKGDDSLDNYCFEKSAQYLLKKGASINLISDTQGSLLMQAMNSKNPYPCVKLLLHYGANVSYVTENGIGALFYSVLKGDPDIVKVLLEHGASVSEPYHLESDQIPYAINDVALKSALKNGATPLMIAVSLGHAAVTKVLMDHGANPKQKNVDGVSALSLAENNGDQVILDILR